MSNAIPKDAKIYIAGHGGLVGSAIHRRLQAEGYAEPLTRTHAELDLERQSAVEAFFQTERPEYVFLAAARVGGIWANQTYPAEFLYDNLAIQTHVLQAAWQTGVRRLLFLGSSCVYPRDCPQPMREEHLLTGPLEPTNQPYAIAKIAGIVACEAYNRQHGTRFLAVMPTNLYGPNDNFDLEKSHVLPALIRKFHLARLASEGDWGDIARDRARFGPIPADFLSCLIAISESEGHTGFLPTAYSLLPTMGSAPSALRPLPSDFSWSPDLPAPAPLSSRPAVELWGTGSARREFLHVDDLAAACVFLMDLPDDTFSALCSLPSGGVAHPGVLPTADSLLPSSGVADLEPLTSDLSKSPDLRPPTTGVSLPLINIGCGEDQSVRTLASLVAQTMGYQGEVSWDSSRPDGTPRKLLDVSRMTALGWRPAMSLQEGIKATYAWYREQL